MMATQTEAVALTFRDIGLAAEINNLDITICRK